MFISEGSRGVDEISLTRGERHAGVVAEIYDQI